MTIDFCIASDQFNQVFLELNELIEVPRTPWPKLQDQLEHGSALGHFSLANAGDSARGERARRLRKQAA